MTISKLLLHSEADALANTKAPPPHKMGQLSGTTGTVGNFVYSMITSRYIHVVENTTRYLSHLSPIDLLILYTLVQALNMTSSVGD